jgi:integrase/recombinase XerD
LFEGQAEEKYSTIRVRAIFRKAVAETNSNPGARVHSLWHSFATHCIVKNLNLAYLQQMLGHNYLETRPKHFILTIKISKVLWTIC